MPSARPPTPRLLLLEDDLVSARFLRTALGALPARVAHATTLAQAGRLAGAADAAWVFDARLPDGHSAELLPRLRAAGLQVPALALSADVDAGVRRRLFAAGFADVLPKPIAGDELRNRVRALIALRPIDPAGDPPAADPSAWDDAAALAALGSADAVRALRVLFLAELPAQHLAVQAAIRGGDHAVAREVLHRMTSGCGFVGATALLQAVRAIAAAPGDDAALARLDACARALTG